MKVGWVISESAKLKKAVLTTIFDTGPTWASCKFANKDVVNLVAYSLEECQTALESLRETQTLYMPESCFEELKEPSGTKSFGGEFKSQIIRNKHDIVAINIAAAIYDIVLLYGFDFNEVDEEDHESRAYYLNVATVIKDSPNTNFVFIDYEGELSSEFSSLPNILLDSLNAAKSLL